jgi:hypothetical protein
MSNEKSFANDSVGSTVTQNLGANETVGAKGYFTVECRDAEGNVKWIENSPNLVVNVGVQDMNTKYFTGSSYTAAWYLGLITGPGASNTYAAGDTMSSHAGWSENTSYSQATRPACSFGAATTANPSVISNSGSAATFSINGTATIAGAFLTSNNTKSGTTGTLFSASNFTSPGDRSVVNGDTLTVTYTFSLTAT